MIVYDLVCAQKHRFEGWFGSAEEFARQREDTLIRCPVCDDAAIERLPSANVQVGRAAEPVAQEEPVVTGNAEALQLLRRMIAATDDVGRAFAEEARKIHYDEAPKRGIRGQATREEADELTEEGIDFLPVPGFLTRDLN
jgi:hypothetical protein